MQENACVVRIPDPLFLAIDIHDVYLDLEYGSNKPALISHLWHGDDLVLGNKENIALTSRNVLGNQILEAQYNSKYITFTLSIS
jgi:hypothetical protein